MKMFGYGGVNAEGHPAEQLGSQAHLRCSAESLACQKGPKKQLQSLACGVAFALLCLAGDLRE
jgi:hypothetical protein